MTAANPYQIDWPDRFPEFAKRLKPELPKIEKRFDRSLQKAGFDEGKRRALLDASPLRAAQMLLEQIPVKTFFERVLASGKQLANLNVAPDEITAALDLAYGAIHEMVPDYPIAEVREQIDFRIRGMLDRGFCEAREAETRLLLALSRVEVETGNADVLLHGFLQTFASSVGAAAGHAFLAAASQDVWELQASTAPGPLPQTERTVKISPKVRPMLEKPIRCLRPNLILDPGWVDQFACVWSIPFGAIGVIQLAFDSERDLLPRELDILMASAARCDATVRRIRLLDDIAAREERLTKLAIRMLMVEENERRRISRELHDDAGQSLVVIRLQMELIEQALPADSEERERLAEAREITEKTILDIRRLISDLSPAVLEQLGLGAAIRQLANRFRIRYPCNLHLQIGELPQLDTNFQSVIYRLAQECFNNIAQHSSAKSVNISVGTSDRVLRLHMQDNGVGFNVEEALGRKDCFGLAGIRERVALLGGSVRISSTPKLGDSSAKKRKSGTVVEIELPISE